MRFDGEGERRRGSVTAAARENAMGGQDMNEKLFAEMDWQTDAAVRALRGEMLLAAAKLEQKRRRRRETLLFALCACAFALLLGLGLWLALAGGLKAAALFAVIRTALICAGATLLLSPLLAYFMEGRGEHA